MYIVGIDTGGTYTDGVVIDYTTKEIVDQTKVFTTKEDLNICIERCFQKLQIPDLGKVKVVSLATTLATNSIVEGTSCASGTILIGKRPEGRLPETKLKVVDGLLSIKGEIKYPLTESGIEQAIRHFRTDGKGVEAIAISGYASTRNPKHELEMKKAVREQLHLPVVCAHDLTTSLGFNERTVTATLNAGLIPLITELMEAVRRVFTEAGVDASYMIVDGKGTLLYVDQVLEQPIQTILSGPASCMMGAQYLTNVENGLIADIGGTTTDIALVKDGKITMDEEGATVGGWKTRVRAADLYTFGLGGDSRVYIDGDRQVVLTTERVWPYCYMLETYGWLREELASLGEDARNEDLEILQTYRKPSGERLKKEIEQVLEVLAEGQHCVGYIREKTGIDDIIPVIDRMHQKNLIIRGGFTPTDYMHVTGLYREFCTEGSEFLLKQMCRETGMEKEVLLEVIRQRITDRFLHCCNDVTELSEDMTLVCIGAPARSWMKMMEKDIPARVIVPEYHAVANAIGAAVGTISPVMDILIRPNRNHNGILLHTPQFRKEFTDLDSAKAYALEWGKAEVERIALEAGSKSLDIDTSVEDVYTQDYEGRDIYTETQIRITATGLPYLYQ